MTGSTVANAVGCDGHGDGDGGYEALRRSAAWRVLARDALSVSGPDAATYLQGQVSQDVEGLAVDGSAESLLLSPQGKVEALIRVTRTGDERFVLDTEGGFGEAVEERLRRFRLRVKVDIETLDWECVAVRGPEAASAVAGQPTLVLPVAWPGLAGIDLLGPVADGGIGGWVDGSVRQCSADAWEAARIEAGIPVMGREIVEGTIAAEVGVVDRTVSFTKGCFTGQELVARLDARGSKVARSLCGVVIGDGDDGSGAPPVGAAVTTADGEHLVGTLTSVAWSPRQSAIVGLATLHRRVVPPETVTVSWDTNGVDRRVVAETRPLPLIS